MSEVLTKEEILRLPTYLRPASGKLSETELAKRTPFERDKAASESADIAKHMSTAGELNLPPLLDVRRLEYGIPDEMFGAAATYNYVLVYQISQTVGDTYGDTSIVMPDRTKAREVTEAPRGIIVTAGLGALDSLRSNGINLGHIVMFSRNIPYRARMAVISARDHNLLVLQAGDIFASEDLARARILSKTNVQISTDADTQFDYHYNADLDGKLWKPHAPSKRT